MERGERRYKGVRRRRWGKWVSEVRVPGTPQRLWLGSYSTPEAAAVAYDTAVFYLKGPSSTSGLNFPGRPPPGAWAGLSPRSIQQAATDTGMAVDTELVSRMPSVTAPTGHGVGAAAGPGDNAAYNTYVRNETGESTTGGLSFPGRLPPSAWAVLPPRSIQPVATETGTAVDTDLVSRMPSVTARTGHGAGAAPRPGDNAAYNRHGRNETGEDDVLDMEIFL